MGIDPAERALHSQIASTFAQFLRERGYSPSSVVSQPAPSPTGEGRLYRPDFLIVDPARREPLAVVEIKGSDRATAKARTQLEAYAKTLGDARLALFVATPTSEPGGFRIQKLSPEGNLVDVPLEQFPSLDALTTATIATSKKHLRHDVARTTDRFRITCFALAAIALLAGVCDLLLEEFGGISLLTPERLTVFGAAIVLIVIPFAAKFKGFGFEYERYRDHEGLVTRRERHDELNR
jgi:hypothetical protein